MKSKDVQWVGGYPFLAYQPDPYTPDEMKKRSHEFLSLLQKRRSIREFSDEPVSIEIIHNCILAASSAPSGANKQPYTFCVVADPMVKAQIREAAEKEEYESYTHRMSEEWLTDLKAFQTDWRKPFLEIAPYIIVVFKKAYDLTEDGTKKNNYYVAESVGLACGFLLAALHYSGLSALTHTPSPMNFLTALLKRPENERPFLLIPVGHASPDARVPDQSRKALEDILVQY